MSKGQIAGQIFVYILAALVIGMIVLMGAWAIQNLLKKSCQVDQLNFKSRLSAMIEKYNSYGSVKKESFKAPCEYDTVCFVDTRRIGQSFNMPAAKCPNAIIRNSVLTNDRTNIFAMSKNRVRPIGYSEFIELSDQDACSCIKPKTGTYFITFSGKGSTTLLTFD